MKREELKKKRRKSSTRISNSYFTLNVSRFKIFPFFSFFVRWGWLEANHIVTERRTKVLTLKVNLFFSSCSFDFPFFFFELKNLVQIHSTKVLKTCRKFVVPKEIRFSFMANSYSLSLISIRQFLFDFPQWPMAENTMDLVEITGQVVDCKISTIPTKVTEERIFWFSRDFW